MLNTLVKVTNISRFGIWLYVDVKEYFLPYDKFPWFAEAKIKQIFNVKLSGKNHLYWPELDVDLSLKIIENPDNFPLIAK